MHTSPSLFASQLCPDISADTPLLFGPWVSRNAPQLHTTPPAPAASAGITAALRSDTAPQPLQQLPCDRDPRASRVRARTRTAPVTADVHSSALFSPAMRKQPLLNAVAPVSRIPALFGRKRGGASEAVNGDGGGGGGCTARKSRRYSGGREGGAVQAGGVRPHACNAAPAFDVVRPLLRTPQRFGRCPTSADAPVPSGARLDPHALFAQGDAAIASGAVPSAAVFGRGSSAGRTRARAAQRGTAPAPTPPMVSPEVNPLAAAAAELGFTYGLTLRGCGELDADEPACGPLLNLVDAADTRLEISRVRVGAAQHTRTDERCSSGAGSKAAATWHPLARSSTDDRGERASMKARLTSEPSAADLPLSRMPSDAGRAVGGGAGRSVQHRRVGADPCAPGARPVTPRMREFALSPVLAPADAGESSSAGDCALLLSPGAGSMGDLSLSASAFDVVRTEGVAAETKRPEPARSAGVPHILLHICWSSVRLPVVGAPCDP